MSSSGRGLMRGASKQPVYDGTRTKAQATSRLYLDARGEAAWRQRDFHSVLGDGNGQAALLKRMLELGRSQPLVIVIDDVHWASPTLLELIEHLVEQVTDAPVLLLCTARPLMLDSLYRNDIWVTATIFLWLAAVLVIANLLADIALGLIDPRVRQAGAI